MSMAPKTHTQSPALHGADSHDLIRVQGARVNNLKDVSVEIPKRRLTVFTGVSGSGKSSLVFGTIAAESQRMINETYSAFVQGFMPTLQLVDERLHGQIESRGIRVIGEEVYVMSNAINYAVFANRESRWSRPVRTNDHRAL